MKTSFVIDGCGLAYRSYFSHMTLTTSLGYPTGCIYGFLVTIRALKKKYPYCEFYVTWDNYAKRKTDIFPMYKAARKSGVNLNSQIMDVKEILKTIKVFQVEHGGEEADDVMASLSHNLISEAPDSRVFIYSKDKDMLQLVEDGRVVVIQWGNGGNPDVAYDEEMVRKKYGVFPKDFPCYQSFRGDTIDGVPGVPYLKSKLISYLSDKYKDPRMVFAGLNSENLTKYQKEIILENEKQIFINYELVRLKRNLSLKIADGNPDPTKLEALLNKYEIKSLAAEQFVKSFDTVSGIIKTSPQLESYTLFQEGEVLHEKIRCQER